ncbi:response regulator [Microcoleus sp. FACHB-831]|uniref:response regulator n=1 Tax=Microcoleus sp. FACHB-831 TaxID=2692827 RepID=UPI0016865C7C|nr:response regulator [Microcoleus sp. FACHB-831]MBD1920987.1 response regulator [Microcoleus sp. FACHB-831]
MRILIVEDDELAAKALVTVLSNQNYAVEVATDGQAGWALVEAFAYDLVMLDVVLPKLDGISLCQRLRQSGYQMPILLLTGRDSSHDKVVGLDAGADDYVVKPFEPEELVARVRALLRRGSSTSLPVLEWGELRLDPTSCEVSYGTRPIQVTPKEYSLLELLLRNNRRVFSCGMILEHLWSYEETPGEEAVRTHIKGLRQKLKAAGAPTDLIETVYGIGYRLKPLEVIELPPTSPETTEKTRQQTLSALAGIWERFKGKISEQVSVIEQATTALSNETLDRELRDRAESEAHTLAGGLGTFGFTKGSQLARKIERLFQNEFSQKEVKQLRKLVGALRQEIELPPEKYVSTTETHKDERPLLLVVDGDRALTLELVNAADIQGIRAEIATNLSEARKAIAQKHPNVVLLDLSVSRTTEDSLTLLAELSKQTPPVPVLVFTTEDSLTTRIEAARLGGRAFLQKTVSPAQVLEAVSEVLQQVSSTQARVMVVDDDPQILATLRRLLEPWGIKVTTLDDPQRFWETLEATQPDLLILDIKMPQVSGVELCRVVRNDCQWGGLPILFLTAYTDADTVNQVFSIGADDFVSKPIVGPELVTRIINRLERIKLLRSLAETDPLTRVSNRRKSTQDLDKFLSKAQHQAQPLCLAILDLDRFKEINERYGHATGDAVLRRVGELLLRSALRSSASRSLRGEDVVSRWGGDEFVIGMYGMTKFDGQQRLMDVLETLHLEEFTATDHTKFRVTFSAGVAQYPEDGTEVQSLYRSADAALYQAKTVGRDRVLRCESI